MSRIFLSHSSVDELEAVALQQWMAENEWEGGSNEASACMKWMKP